MNRRFMCALLALSATTATAQDFDKLIAGAKALDGPFRVHLKDDHLFAELKSTHLNRPMIWPAAVSRGIGVGMLLGGMTLNMEEEWLIEFRRAGDKIHVVRKNVRFRAQSGTPTAHAVERAYTDSIIAGLRIQAEKGGSALVDLSELFLSDLAGVGAMLGSAPDRSLSTYHAVKAFPENIMIDTSLVFRSRGLPLDTVADPRSISVGVIWSLSFLPNDGYRPRVADDRVGYFVSAVKDYSRDAGDTSFVRYVNRWRLEKVDPSAKMSPPKKPIRFWIERSVPHEYRRYVREGILEWNKAFERLGFIDAIEVRQQDEKDDFDPEDIRYNTVRWITSSAAFAMGPSRINPLTGEILDADIIFDADMVRFEREEYEMLAADPAKLVGFAFEGGAPGPQSASGRSRCGCCNMSHGMKRELTLGLVAAEARGMWKPGDPIPIEFIGDSIRHTMMHEVGHTLGLRHNFKASSISTFEQISDPKNREKATIGSVMDYLPMHVAAKGKSQGAFYPLTIGPYDVWAIEYAYTPPPPGAADLPLASLQAIASRSAQKELAYAPDEDTYRPDGDALAATWDLGDDPLKYGEARLELLVELLDGLPDRVTGKGEGWQRTRRAMGSLLHTHALNAYFAAKMIGGTEYHRDHKGDPEGRPAVTAVPAARQRAALDYLRRRVFSEAAFSFKPDVLGRLAPTRWWHWGMDPFEGDLTFPLHDYVLLTQRTALSQLFSGVNLRRLRETELLAPAGGDAVTTAELFRAVTDAVWFEGMRPLPDRELSDRKPLLSGFRRSLQREYVEALGRLAMPKSAVPADARSLARLQLRRIATLIETELPKSLSAGERRNKSLDDTTDAHLQDARDRIRKLLDPTVTTP